MTLALDPPSGWKVRPLTELVTRCELGGTYKNGSSLSPVPLVKMGNLGRGRISTAALDYVEDPSAIDPKHLLRDGDLLFNTRNTLELVGKVALWRSERPGAVYDSNILRLAFDASLMSGSAFMNYWFNSQYAIRELRRRAIGTTSVAAIYWRDLRTLRVALPPISEQEKIAAVLSTWDRAIELTETLIAAKRKRKQALMQQLLTGKVRFGESKAPGKPVDRHLALFGRIPKDWSDERIGDLFDMQLGKMLSEKARTGTAAKPYLGNSHVRWGTFQLNDLPQMDFAEGERRKFRLSAGDILVCEGGEVGRTAIWEDELAECYYQKALHRLRPKTRQIERHYFRYLMEYSCSRRIFEAVTGNSSIAHLTRETLAKVAIPLPPLEEQRSIVNVLECAEREITLHEKKLASLSTEKKGLMQQLLTGKVRVKVDAETTKG